MEKASWPKRRRWHTIRRHPRVSPACAPACAPDLPPLRPAIAPDYAASSSRSIGNLFRAPARVFFDALGIATAKGLTLRSGPLECLGVNYVRVSKGGNKHH